MTHDTDALLAADPDFAAICDARRDAAIEHMEAASALDMGAVYRTHAADVRAYLRSRGCSRDCAEDLTQTAFLKAHRARHTYNPALASVGGWLRMIARSVLLDAARAKGRRPEDLTDPNALASYGAVEAPDSSPWDVAPSRVADALRGLPASQREAVSALYLDGLTAHEAGERLGAEAGAVRVRACRGVAVLRLLLTPTNERHRL